MHELVKMFSWKNKEEKHRQRNRRERERAAIRPPMRLMMRTTSNFLNVLLERKNLDSLEMVGEEEEEKTII